MRAIEFYVSIVCLVYSHANPCGPGRQCSCVLPDQMDCLEVNVTLEEICDSLGNGITKLRAENNNFQEVRTGDVRRCYSLKSLLLRNNNIRMDNRTFYNKMQFPLSLKTLKLNGNSKTNISDKLYYPDLSYLKNLEELFIDGLQNTEFPESYRQLTNLKTIVITGLAGNCDITQITNETIKNLVNVIHFNLSACNIDNLYAGAFKEMHKLEVLDLSGNRRMGLGMLRNITYGLQFTKIKSLNISKVQTTFGMSTQITKRDICYLWNTSINEIVLNSNRIAMFETNTPILLSNNLQVVHVEDNLFTFGPYILQIGCLSKLTHFYGNHQNFAHSPRLYDTEPKENRMENRNSDTDDDCPYMTTEFMRNASKDNKYCRFFEPDQTVNIHDDYPMFPTDLKTFHFASSAMVYNVTEFVVFPPLNSIEYLDFSGNVLYALTGPVGPFPQLKYLDLSKNYCSFVSVNLFDGSVKLENLQFQQNFLGLVIGNEIYGPYVFEKLVNLKTLNLSSNIISYIHPDTLSAMSDLNSLDLSTNNIETWTIDVQSLHSLLTLNLRTNSFQTLPRNLTSKLEENSRRLNKPFSIDMRNNAIIITCEAKDFLEWMVKNQEHFVSFEENSFKDSQGLSISAAVFVSKVKGLDKECQSYTLEIVIGTIALSVFLAIVIGGFIYKNRWNLRYLMRLTKLRHFGYRPMGLDIDHVNYRYDAFISYANENLRFILDFIVPKLENRGFRLCLHDRDFLLGDNIADNIINAVRNSRTTVIVLSKDFLKSEWCLYEFNMARMESIYSRAGSNCLLVVMYEDVSNRDMPNEMLEWITTNTYLEYTTDEAGLELFLDSLYEALCE